MNITHPIDLKRLKVNSLLNSENKTEFGQYFTPSTIAKYMASLFSTLTGDINLIEPGAGVGSLAYAVVEEAVKSKSVTSFKIKAFEIDKIIIPHLESTLSECIALLDEQRIKNGKVLINEDFILHYAKKISDTNKTLLQEFSHVIMNPPYKKIASKGIHRNALTKLGIETVNLYSGFVAVAIKLLKPGGELVAIIPRSFCNGPYYYNFRKILLEETYIRQIHIFENRDKAFNDDEVLQENIIISCQKNGEPKPIKITASPFANFEEDFESQEYIAPDTTVRYVDLNSIVKNNDPHKFIHIATTNSEQKVIDTLSCFTSTLEELKLQVSTGPVVGFRAKKHLRFKNKGKVAPLIYPHNLDGSIHWQETNKKETLIAVNSETQSSLWVNTGHFVVVKRFSSKEEKRRIFAAVYDSSLPFQFIGFENMLNVFHSKKSGFDEDVAKGLYVYLNSTLLDKYYRQFGGHTQVNATDLKSLNYPNLLSLKRMGRSVKTLDLTSQQFDVILAKEISTMTGTEKNEFIEGNEKILEAISVLKEVGMPKPQQNERSALTLLALLNLAPSKSWNEIEQPIIGVTPIMEWSREVYEKEYAPNTRETFRRQTLHQLVSAGLVLYNPDDPDRAVNSPKACYQIAPDFYNLLRLYKTKAWEKALKQYLELKPSLVERYAKARDMAMLPLEVAPELILKLSAGSHSELIRDIVIEFGSRFAAGGKVLYVGDTGKKEGYYLKEDFEALGLHLPKHGKIPDVVIYDGNKNWLFLIESVTSHGPIDHKRYEELQNLFKSSTAGLIYVSAFPNRSGIVKYLSEISWETEVWFADSPTHMIHFNGDRFMGPR